MKILLGESLAQFIAGHDGSLVVGLGWQGIKHGQLLQQAQSTGFEVLISADKPLKATEC